MVLAAIVSGNLSFLCMLYSLTDHYIQNEVSKFYRVNHNLNVRGHDDMGIYRLAVHDLGGVQVVLRVQSL